MNRKKIDKNFDGHLEKPLSSMTPKEKLDYIWCQIELKKYIKDKVMKKRIQIMKKIYQDIEED